MNTITHKATRAGAWSASALIVFAALSGCDREPTPKLSANDLGNATANGAATTTAQADTGTAMGTGSVAGVTSGSPSPGGTPPADDARQTSAPGSAGSSRDGGFDAMTRDNPTAAGIPGAVPGGQTPPSAGAATAGALNSAEQKFIAEAGARSLFNIEVSELAADKATDPALKSYAAMVVADQKGSGEELKRLAAGHGVDLPQSLLPADQKTLSALRNAKGQAFDKQYLQTAGVTEHEKAIATFEKASAEARNPAVKDYVQSTLPTLKSHLDAARKLQTKG